MTFSLQPGARITGPNFPGPVTIVAVTQQGQASTHLVYRDASEAIHEVVIFAEDYGKIEQATSAPTANFKGDGEAWRLAAEALRIKYAALYDPMIAVTTSEIIPLPHQIRAVYGEFLKRTPLRYLLADDPGAGKTIMCGLYMKELLLRGDLERALVVAPGGLVDQWQDELRLKFGLNFQILTNELVNYSPNGNPFIDHPHLIARMDHLARREDLQEMIDALDFDLIVVDEAHRMSAHYYGQELQVTKRYALGQTLGDNARNLLLMTATPHAGKDEDYQAFLALLDPDRFEGQGKSMVGKDDAADIMRRMIKEDLLTMEGKPLFQERVAMTANYELSPGERDLYEQVSQYVRTEMNRAKRLMDTGNKKLGNTVGFALTVLQRRLASSPEAILRSLERRRKRLQAARETLQDIADGKTPQSTDTLGGIVSYVPPVDPEDLDELDEFNAEDTENIEEEIMDAASAAMTVEELDKEIATLGDLVGLATRVRSSEVDHKWIQLRAIIDGERSDDPSKKMVDKLIVFTEHKDTLKYLVDRIRDYLGDDAAVAAIYGGTPRDERRQIREDFTHSDRIKVLVATDAAGEGLNLQAAHMMVNYDLPWNPNRIEQRFGRIHRIGQREVCFLWNLVSTDTREGQVYQRLLAKLEEMSAAYKGKVFDVLGQVFDNRPLRDLMMDAVIKGEDPETKAYLERVIDENVGNGIRDLIEQEALDASTMSQQEIDEVRRRMEEARARRLQPHFIRDFFLTAFEQLGGTIRPRESERFEITRVPAAIRERATKIGMRLPVAERYTRVTFELDAIEGRAGVPRAELIAPGHALLDTVVDLIVEQHRATLKDGAVLVDANTPERLPRLLVAVEEEILDQTQPRPNTVSKKFSFVEIDAEGNASNRGAAPYLDYQAADARAQNVASEIKQQAWFGDDPEQRAKTWSAEHSLKLDLHELQQIATATAARTRKLVEKRLSHEAMHWDAESIRIAGKRANGQRTKYSPEWAKRKAQDIRDRLERRLGEIDAASHLSAKPARIAGVALVIPGEPEASVPDLAKDTRHVERRAVNAVLAAERALGRTPTEMPHNNPGYDVRSVAPDGHVIFIEVKGRIAGSDEFLITRNEVQTAKNLGDDYRLALVRVSQDDAAGDEVAYLTRPFDKTHTDDFRQTRFGFGWEPMWSSGGAPR